jgi:hypothetical protein
VSLQYSVFLDWIVLLLKERKTEIQNITLPANENSDLNAGSAITSNFYLLH